MAKFLEDGQESGWRRCRVHDLRHSTITRLAEKGTPIAVIQEIAGHGHMSAKMTKHYTHISDAVKRKALESLHTETVQ